MVSHPNFLTKIKLCLKGWSARKRAKINIFNGTDIKIVSLVLYAVRSRGVTLRKNKKAGCLMQSGLYH